MARTYLEFSIPAYSDAVDQTIRQILIGDHYREIDYNREVVWKKGTGVMTGMHYIKVEYPNSQTVRLSGWVQIGLGPVGGREHDLEGLTGAIPKKSTKKTMEKIQAAVLNTCGAAPFSQQNQPPQPKQNQQTPPAMEKKIIFCPNCGCQLRIPVKQNKIEITCPKCRHQFLF